MVFSSLVFLFAFLPAFLAVYSLVPWRPAKNVVLLLFSLFFYAWGEPVYVFLMVCSILINWVFALAMERSRVGVARSQWILIGALAANIGILAWFKYAGFAAKNILRITSFLNMPLGEEYWASLEGFDVALPIGISFFTLQAISYVIDVYRGGVKAQRNPIYLGMYIAMFPQLIAGPIVRYAQIENEINTRKITLAAFAQGLRLFVIGLGKKVLLANTAAVLANSMLSQNAASIGFVGCFSGVAAYTFQIYFDFSGYSDMAIGLGKMMGFNYPRNFNYPYISKPVTEFWRRWHMTLGSFFRDYVYIPLGGSRVSTPRWMINIMVVWGLTGIWHGAAWNFVLWGLYYGIFLMAEKLFLLKILSCVPRIIQHVYCIVAFFFGWMLFSLTGLHNVGEWLMGMFGVYGLTGTSTLWELQSWGYVSLIPVFVVATTPVFPWLRKRIEAWACGGSVTGFTAAPEKGNDAPPPCEIVCHSAVNENRARVCTIINMLVDLALLAVLVVSCISIASGGYNPFIYFQF